MIFETIFNINTVFLFIGIMSYLKSKKQSELENYLKMLDCKMEYNKTLGDISQKDKHELYEQEFIFVRKLMYERNFGSFSEINKILSKYYPKEFINKAIF